MKKIARIKPDEWYTMQDVIKGNMFPWCGSLWSVRNLVTLDRKNKNILKVVITGTGRGTKYNFQGKNITRFVKLFEAGTIRL